MIVGLIAFFWCQQRTLFPLPLCTFGGLSLTLCMLFGLSRGRFGFLFGLVARVPIEKFILDLVRELASYVGTTSAQ